MELIKEYAETYNELERALNNGHIVQLSTINSDGKAVGWHDVDDINKNFDPNRYRIISRDHAEFERKVNEGMYYNDREDKWYKI